MTTVQALTGCVRAIENMRVPVGLMEEVIIPIYAVRNTLNMEIAKLKEAEKQGKEEKADADDTVQRADAQPEQH
ncbi:MAG: hypothetical protein IKH57_21230 [Clostridia bacterium]|nr:hypothetical protein [Clostridia bacterium]